MKQLIGTIVAVLLLGIIAIAPYVIMLALVVGVIALGVSQIRNKTK